MKRKERLWAIMGAGLWWVCIPVTHFSMLDESWKVSWDEYWQIIMGWWRGKDG